MSKRLYVAYGSNLNMQQMAARCPTAKVFGVGEIKDFELQFKGHPHSAFATIVPKEGKSVPVLLWELKPKDEKSLDIYEGYPSHYIKQDIVTEVNGEKYNAMVYIMNQKQNFGIPTQRYYDTVYDGYENCQFDPDILNEAVNRSINEFNKQDEKYARYFSLFNDGDEQQEEEPEDMDEDCSCDNQMHW